MLQVFIYIYFDYNTPNKLNQLKKIFQDIQVILVI